MFGANPKERAYLAPFLVFMALLAVDEVVRKLFEGQAWWVVATPRYWVFPLQTIVCGALIAANWKHYEFAWPARPLFTIGIGVLVLALWVAPQEVLGMPKRWDGFDPGFFGGDAAYVANVGTRLIRMVIVIPLLEEIFWRGFLLRYLINNDFTRIPIGQFTWLSFGVAAVLFTLAHTPADYGAAILAGALYNAVAYRTRSLSSCVLVHAVTNLLLGVYILRTGQWGFW